MSLGSEKVSVAGTDIVSAILFVILEKKGGKKYGTHHGDNESDEKLWKTQGY